MLYRFEFHPYRRAFKRPLQTSHGSWEVRDGIIVSLSDETGISYGEIAPISWFGSETLAQAVDFCRQLPSEITEEMIFSIPDQLPACQFGFESAWEGAGEQGSGGAGEQGSGGAGGYKRTPNSLRYSALLPAGEGALEAWQALWDQGYRTFKWKIGVNAIADELAIFDVLTQKLPGKAKLRLDANGGLSYDEANLWLENCDRKLAVEIEFIEQPLPVEQFNLMQELSYCYGTAIALDESVATLNQLKTFYQQGWRGIFVIKPSISGSPSRLRQFCQKHQIDLVFSSAFETDVGRQAALNLAVELSRQNRAVGFGINHWFDQDKT
ncbi:MAG: o-succinylbenzoate synthase [Gloeocapsa sp. UFS-A4-WI-NPMV-4B04]|jgi:O-succinylbenzoate synthase|nr:o-succinylbenzoate synthase [Gloeocapsa sp. UFS-A4-WI-NPMV-4B04]